MIRSENLSISFGKRILLEKESFTMQRGEKIGLAGRNGSGKSTLLSLIAGEREPDSGKIIIPKNYTVAYMKQKLSFTHDNLIDECASCLPEDCRHEEYQAKKNSFRPGLLRQRFFTLACRIFRRISGAY